MEKFNFDPASGFNDSSAFPDPSNEAATREQLQRLHNQLRDYINAMATQYGQEVVMFRVNNAKALEFSIDGLNWDEIVGRGERGPVGPGIVPGGTTGQFYRKKSNADYDGEFTDLPIATDSEVGGVKVKSSTDSTITKDANGVVKTNQLVINELEITNAPVQELATAEWWDTEEQYKKYIDVVVEGCVASAKPDHWMMTDTFESICKVIQARDGVLRFILSNDVTDATITTTIKDLILQYQD